MCGDPKRLVKVVQNYKIRCPPPAAGSQSRRPPFSIGRYQEEVRQEAAIIFDGVYEMMSKVHFVSWMGKTKNGNMDAEEAALLWKQKHDTVGATTDLLGTNPKYPQRVAIKKTDLIKLRDSHIKS